MCSLCCVTRVPFICVVLSRIVSFCVALRFELFCVVTVVSSCVRYVVSLVLLVSVSCCHGLRHFVLPGVVLRSS